MSFHGIRLASRALLAHQHALEITGQNITNAETPGYSRQVPVARPVPGYSPAAGGFSSPGGGVDVALVRRTHAAWLDRAASRLRTSLGQSTISERYAAQLEGLLAEPTDRGLQATMDRFFTAFGTLSNRPEDLSARAGVGLLGSELAHRFQQLTEGMDALREEVARQAKETVATANDLARQVAALSGAVSQAQASGASASELLDQRDQLLADLTRLTGAVVSGQDGGEIVVSVGGRTLVQGPTANELSLAVDGTLALSQNGGVVEAPGGELRALTDWFRSVLPEYRAQVAAIRDGLATAVNALHQSGRDLNGAPGEAFFLSDLGGNLVVNPNLSGDPRRVVAGDGTPGDGAVARAIADLRGAPGHPFSAYPTLVADLGRRAGESHREAGQSRASLEQVEIAQSSESGVNLDEELSQMVQYQHAYAASARLLATFDDMLKTLIDQV